MKYYDITVSKDGNVAVVVLSRPQAINALSMRLRDELESFLRGIQDDASIDVVVIAGGGRFFSAGFDLKEAVSTRLASFSHRIFEFHEAIYNTDKFIITAVSGIALAGAFDLALAGDIILATPSASFGHVEVNFGINPLVFPLAWRVGAARAAELCATGRIISAEEAHRMGIVTEIINEADFMSAVHERAFSVARMGGDTLRAIKPSARSYLPVTVVDALTREFSITKRLIEDDALVRRLTDYLASVGIKA